MHRFSTSIVVCLLLIMSGCAENATRPNVILVMTDDQGYGDIGVHGHPLLETPNLDELHSESVRLTDFHVDPTCSPSRAALMTGRYSSRSGVWHTIMGRSLMNPDEITIAEVFKDNGYDTGMIGKWHLGDNYPLRPQDQGFDDAFYHRGGGVGQGPDFFGNDYFDDTYVRNGVEEKVEGYVTDVWFNDAVEYVSEHKDNPFFLYLSTNAPHGPFIADEKYAEPYVDAGAGKVTSRFLGMIANIDENMGRLTDHLDDLGLSDNTILIFMTDNGSAQDWAIRADEEGAWAGYGAGMRGVKASEYDGGHRVPFFIRWPDGGLFGGRDVDQLSAHIDVLPTLAKLANLKLPDSIELDGVSLVSTLQGNTEELQDRTILVHSQRVPVPIKWRKSAVMTNQWRLVNQNELYDMVADPGQTSDVSADHSEVVSRLRVEYDSWWLSLAPSFDKIVRIGLGSKEENPVNLSAHDWFVTEQSLSPWSQNHIRNGHIGNGHWEVDVQKSGDYLVTLRRWPVSEPGPIEAVLARMNVGGSEIETEVSVTDEFVEFAVELDAGPTTLQTWLTLPSGESRGAYYVSVEKVVVE